MNRRERLAELYGVNDLLDEQAPNSPVFTVDLSSKKLRKKVAKKYGFSHSKFETFLKDHKFTDRKEVISNRGKITSCKKSYLIDFMEQEVYPEGLSRRQKRAKDDKALKVCH